jgi:hypothetical protein
MGPLPDLLGDRAGVRRAILIDGPATLVWFPPVIVAVLNSVVSIYHYHTVCTGR